MPHACTGSRQNNSLIFCKCLISKCLIFFTQGKFLKSCFKKLGAYFYPESEARGGSRTAAIFKMELFVIVVNGFQTLTIITKSSILDFAAALDPPLEAALHRCSTFYKNTSGGLFLQRCI